VASDPLAEFKAIGRELVDQHLISARGGNMSLRLADGRTLITRHDSMNGFLSAADIAEIGAGGEVSGPEPSSDTPVHLAIYGLKGPGAVVHAHPRHAVALSLTGRTIRPVNLEGRLHLTEVPVVPSGLADDVAGPVAAALADRRVCMVEGHGCYAFAPDLWTALQWVTVLEEAAQILVLRSGLDRTEV
jgi:L-fuculose-phosphate aldolase